MSDRRGPRTYEPRAFPPFAVTVDVVVFTTVEDELQVLLVERGQDPFRGAWALPGGFVRPREGLADAAARELAEETAVARGPDWLEQLGAWGNPKRDPRMRVVTVAYWAICADLPPPSGGGDAARAALVPVPRIEEGRVFLAFDHAEIALAALARLRARIHETAVAARFCPREFTITQLRRVHEAVWNTRLDPGNFQRRIREAAWLAPADRIRPSGAAGGRPASVWTAREASPFGADFLADGAPPLASAPPGRRTRRPAPPSTGSRG